MSILPTLVTDSDYLHGIHALLFFMAFMQVCQFLLTVFTPSKRG